VNPIAIFAATRWELQAVRRALATDRVATSTESAAILDSRDRTYWLIQTASVLLRPALLREKC